MTILMLLYGKEEMFPKNLSYLAAVHDDIDTSIQEGKKHLN